MAADRWSLDVSLIAIFSVLSGKYVSVVDTPMGYDEASRAVVRKTVSTSTRLGEEVIRARNEGRDPVDTVVNVLDGWKIFEGIVERYTWRDEGGFLKGEVLIRGVGDFSGSKLRSWIKNEHIMVWIDDKPAGHAAGYVHVVEEGWGAGNKHRSLRRETRYLGLQQDLQLYGGLQKGWSILDRDISASTTIIHLLRSS